MYIGWIKISRVISISTPSVIFCAVTTKSIISLHCEFYLIRHPDRPRIHLTILCPSLKSYVYRKNKDKYVLICFFHDLDKIWPVPNDPMEVPSSMNLCGFWGYKCPLCRLSSSHTLRGTRSWEARPSPGSSCRTPGWCHTGLCNLVGESHKAV